MNALLLRPLLFRKCGRGSKLPSIPSFQKLSWRLGRHIGSLFYISFVATIATLMALLLRRVCNAPNKRPWLSAAGMRQENGARALVLSLPFSSLFSLFPLTHLQRWDLFCPQGGMWSTSLPMLLVRLMLPKVIIEDSFCG